MQNSMTKNRAASTKQQSLERELYSPIRQMGQFISTDSGGFQLGLNSVSKLERDQYAEAETSYNSPTFYPNAINNTAMATLSPTKQQSMGDQVKARVIESQPRQLIGDPLQVSVDNQRRLRFGRPNTNSPFPYMQKRNQKQAQLQMPSTAATSNMNQQQNEMSAAKNRYIGQQFSSSGIQSSMMSENETTQSNYRLNHQNLQNTLDISSLVLMSPNNNRTIDQQTPLSHDRDIIDEYSIQESSFYYNQTLENVEKRQSIGESPSNRFTDIPPAFNSGEPDKKPTLITKRPSYKRSKQPTLEDTQNPFNQQAIKKQKGKKRKILTEPNSPSNHFSGAQLVNQDSIYNQSQANVINIYSSQPRDFAQQASKAKNNISLAGLKSGVQTSKIKNKNLIQIGFDSLQKINQSFEDQSHSFSNMLDRSIIETNQIYGISSTAQQDRNHSFLPRLDQPQRLINSQINSTKDANEVSIMQSKERIESIVKASANNWVNDGLMQHYQNNSTKQSRERKKVNLNLNSHINEMIATRQQFSNKQSGKNTHIKVPNKGGQIITPQPTQNTLHESSTPAIGYKDYHDQFPVAKNIGKLPMGEIKQLNEQMIRGKLNRDRNFGMESPQKYQPSAFEHSSNLMITKIGGRKAYAALTEVANTPICESPVNQYDSSKMIKGKINLAESTYINANSRLSGDNHRDSKLMNQTSVRSNSDMMHDNDNQTPANIQKKTQNQQTLSHFHQRNNSVSQGSQKNIIINPPYYQQYNTIEEALEAKDANKLDLKYQRDNSSINVSDQQSMQNTGNFSSKKQFHHTIKTLASKQMPKCFRTNKRSLQRERDTQSNYNRGNSNDSAGFSSVTSKANAFQSNLGKQQTVGGNQMRSQSNDMRVSFNEYSTIQRPSNDHEKIANSQMHSPVKAMRASNYFSKQPTIEDKSGQITERSQDDERERMTPAFNARQSYGYVKVDGSYYK